MKTLHTYSKPVNNETTGITIFLVEDDPMYLLALGQNLHKTPGYNVYYYKSGEDCLRNMNLNPHIIVLDYYLNEDKLNVMNGLDVLRKIKKYNPKTRVVMLSGQKDLDVAIHAIEMGAYTYLIKDKQSLTQLQTIIKEIITKDNFTNQNIIPKGG